MLAKVMSAAVFGVDAYEVQVEVDIAGGLPAVMVVGLPDAAVQESKERVRAAIKNAGFPFPASRIVVNLAPADVRKEGPAFDLPIAVAVLAAQGVVPHAALESIIISGELALDGAIRPVKGAINIGLYCAQAGIKRVLVPPDNAAEAAVVSEVEVYAPATLLEVVRFLRRRESARACPPRRTHSRGKFSGFSGCQGPGRGQTGTRDCRRRGSQRPYDRPARFG